MKDHVTIRNSIKRFEENPDFPQTIGHFYVIIEKAKNGGGDHPFNRTL